MEYGGCKRKPRKDIEERDGADIEEAQTENEEDEEDKRDEEDAEEVEPELEMKLSVEAK